MIEDRFETRLQALFHAPPSFEDAQVFNARVAVRLSRSARWRADLTIGAGIVAGAGVLWGLLSSLEQPAIAGALAQLSTAASTAQGVDGIWLIPCLAVALVLGVQAVEDGWVRD